MIYLDNAATTWPKPRLVYDAVKKALKRPFGNPGRGSHKAASHAAETVYELREAAAEMFGGVPENVVLTSSATMGLNYAVKGAVKRDCKLLISDIEHNSVRRPALALQQSGICKVGVYGSHDGSPGLIIEDLYGKIEPGRTVIVANHLSNICNLALPVAEIGKICRDTGCIFIVDASQSAGHIDIDVDRMRIDVLCMPGHKGLYGPMGTGLLIFSSAAANNISAFGTLVEGGSGTDSELSSMPGYLPERFEAGTLNAHGAAGLLAGIRWIMKTGIETIGRKEKTLWCALEKKLAESDRITVYKESEPGAILLFNIEGVHPSDVGRLLDEKGICVRTGFHCSPLAHKTLGTGEDGAVRISFSHFNSLSDVEETADLILDITKK